VTITIAASELFSSASKSGHLTPHPERRKNRRFPLRQSATIRYKNALAPEVTAFTLDASVNSVFLTTETAVAEGRAVHVAISLKKDGLETVRLHGIGNVVRTVTLPTGRFGIAVAFEKPLTATV
jgi:hypothetical protein